MAQTERAKENRRDAQRAERRRERITNAPKVSMTDIDTAVLIEALAWVVQAGGALRIGTTRDGGAWAFGIYGDGPTPYTEYVRPDEDVNGYLIKLGEFFANLVAR